MTIFGAIAQWLSRSTQRPQVGDDVAQHAVGRAAEGRHRDAGLNGLRVGNPPPHVLVSIRELSREDRSSADPAERRADIAVGIEHSVDVMAGAASEGIDRRPAARDLVVGPRMSQLSTTSDERREQRERWQDCSARTQWQGRSWSSPAHQVVANLSPQFSTPRCFPGSLPRIPLVLVAVVAVVACSSDRRSTDVNVPDAERGRELANTSGCGACHVISGVRDANGSVGPPLTGIAQRSYIAGMLPNTPQNLALWIRSPQSVKPGNAMPDLGLSTREAEDIAAFLVSRY